MRKILLLTAAAILSLTVAAQDVAQNAVQEQVKSKSNIRYQGEVSLGVGLSLPMPYISGEVYTVHGIRVGEYFSAGIGIGFDFPFLMIPLYVNVTGYLPVSQKTSLTLGLDLGAGINAIPIPCYVSPAFGASIKVSPKYAINVRLAYKTYPIDARTAYIGGLIVRGGFQF